ncbi:peptidoglycan DD-metalloendopeptidase family protein [Arsenicicoccus dermatophilus]|uniref:peptidoglycan DD-metalloendopeptidase family protein n=1 Tax=Arsenicicoccus dermatophilus TaxID=1076331 RepID=UPI001F4C5D1E|nr:peptidoglycan DD-metalloendopeptidase family protein [Arsenicicoccus dermatophilus]MCH8612893.1 M23 family metallopeptidase [Arsenicicoccus dermatophilus]
MPIPAPLLTILPLVLGLAPLVAPARTADPGTSLPTPPVAATAPAPPVARTRWVSPVTPPVVLHPFVAPAHRWSPGHRGVDLALPVDGQVRAAGAGVVAFAGKVAGRPVVAVDHTGIRTTYESVRPVVSVGRTVAAGELLGTLAGPGHCPQGCLHWGALQGENYLDPMSLLAPPEIVLLPLR